MRKRLHKRQSSSFWVEPSERPRPLYSCFYGGLGDIVRYAYWSPFFRMVPELVRHGHSVLLEVCCPYPQVRDLFIRDARYEQMTFHDWGWKSDNRGRTDTRAGEWLARNHITFTPEAEVVYQPPLEPHPQIQDYLNCGYPYIVCQPVGGKVSGYGKRMSPEQLAMASATAGWLGYTLVLLHDSPVDDVPANVLDLTGQTSIAQSCWIVRESSGFIGVDSFLKYIALIYEIPTAVYWGANQHQIEYFLGKWVESPCLRLFLSPDDHVASISLGDMAKGIHLIVEKEGEDGEEQKET